MQPRLVLRVPFVILMQHGYLHAVLFGNLDRLGIPRIGVRLENADRLAGLDQQCLVVFKRLYRQMWRLTRDDYAIYGSPLISSRAARGRGASQGKIGSFLVLDI